MRKLALAALALLSTFAFHPVSVRAQGSLTPPGPPGPTMKTLAQIEPRTPISSAPFSIVSSGSYYLTTNLTVSAGSAITISANNVSLDLNGFTISSTENPATTNCGILLSGSGVANITIVNGFISSGVTNNSKGNFSGSGFGSGIYGALAVNTRVSGVSVSGCLVNGIYLSDPGPASAVESCTVNTVGSYGIVGATVTGSTALNCGYIAIYAYTANNCYGTSLNSGGVSAVVANNCYGTGTGGNGVSSTVANNCLGIDNTTGAGVDAAIAIGCYGSSVSGNGLNCTIANSCYSTTGDSGINYKYNMP